MREQNICKREWTSFSSKAYSGNCPSRQTLWLIWKQSLVLPAQSIYLLTHRRVKKSLFPAQKTSLGNARRLHTAHKVQTWRAEQLGLEELQPVLILKEKKCWAQTKNRTSEPLSTAGLKHQAICSKTDGSWNESNWAKKQVIPEDNLSWKQEDKGRKVKSWMGLGLKAIGKNGKEIELQIQRLQRT